MRELPLNLTSLVILVFLSADCLGQAKRSSLEKDSLLMNEIVAWKEALAIYENGQDYYKLACLYSKIDEPDSAFRYLKRSMELGYSDLNILVDPELASIEKYKEEIGEVWFNLYPDGDFDYALNLLKLEYEDQRSRSLVFEYFESYGRESDEYKQQLKAMAISDSLNVIKLEKLIEINGWPVVSRVGESQVSSAFTILLHANLETKKRYLPFIQESVAEGELPKRAFAYFVDKMKTSEGKDQVYGTQLKFNESRGQYELYPLEDVDRLNTRRFEMGLDSIETYLRRMLETYNR